jgi:NAD(P)-dependent dehydrogenase (short-subunit alcohol dehydrogenase family)
MTMTTSTNNSQSGKTWLITGASTGFGRLLAEHLITLGANVVATARQVDQLKPLEDSAPAQVLPLTLDVTKQDQVDAAVKDAGARFGKIDVLVNNAGYGVMGALEEVHESEFMPMFQTNVFGLIRVTKALLPHFRERRSGFIVNLSSIGGLVASPGVSMYNASKFAVEGLSEALAQEIAPLGIKVILIEPGPFRTDFLGRSLVVSKDRIADYEVSSGKTLKNFEAGNGKQAGDPQKAVEAIVTAVESPEPPLRLLLGKMAMSRFRGKESSMAAEVAKWESVTLNADYPEGK